MMKRNFILLLCFIILANCGFTPIYYGNKNTDFKIEIIEVLGDRDMNNLVKTNLKRYSNDEKVDIFKIKINSTYNKKSLAKDTTGKTTDYRIETNFAFEVEYKTKSQQININEKFDYRSIDDSIELMKYEDTVKQNIANITVQKFVSQMMRME